MRRYGLALSLAFLPGLALAQQGPGGGGPPREALAACQGQASGAACSFTSPRGSVNGTCRSLGGQVACVPGQPPQGQPPQGQPPQAQRPQQGQGQGAQGAPPNGGFTPRPESDRATPTRGLLSDTGQTTCFDDRRVIDCPAKGQPFHGQDGSYSGRSGVLSDRGDGTVFDASTGLTWQKAHNRQRLSFNEARTACDRLTLGGASDWRLPTIRELFSITHWDGATGQRPFLDRRFFDIEEPDASILQGDRYADTHFTAMMGQTWSATVYAGDHYGRSGERGVFFFNFLDGRIKQAPMNGRMGLFYRCVRGAEWGANQFSDSGNGTVTDDLTGLMWQQADDGTARPWQESLAYCEGLTLAGHNDWRLPNVKELQSIVDYSRHDPALDPRFFRQSDRTGWFWSSTTHGERVSTAAYVCFGKCVSVDNEDAHGAGAQRSDPKAGNASDWGPMGGQRDAVRISNYARCVRDAG